MGREKKLASKPSMADCLAQLRTRGCEIREQGAGRFLVSSNGCGAVLEAPASGIIRFAVGPGLMQGEEIAHLLDRGFQKFWQARARQIPARAEELKALHDFQRDLSAALGAATLYNEALGTVSARYIYDRVEGREPGKRHQSFD